MLSLTDDAVICSKEISNIEDEFSLRRRAWEAYRDADAKECNAVGAEIMGMTESAFKQMAVKSQWASAKINDQVPFEFIDHSKTPVNRTSRLTHVIPNEDRKLMLRCFAMYLTGMDAWDIANTLSIPKEKIHYWIQMGKWVKCRTVYQESGVAPEPWEDPEIPLEWADLTEMVKIVPDIFRHVMSEVILDCANEARSWDSETKMERISDILKLSTAGEKIFGWNKPEISAEINMIAPLQAIEVTEHKGFDEVLELEDVK